MAISSSVSGSPESDATDIEPPCVTPTRAISHRTSTILFVRAGGRCQRRGCNARLFEHHLSDPLGAADEGFYAACLGLARSPVPAHGAVAAVAMAEAAEAAALAKIDA